MVNCAWQRLDDFREDVMLEVNLEGCVEFHQTEAVSRALAIEQGHIVARPQ